MMNVDDQLAVSRATRCAQRVRAAQAAKAREYGKGLADGVRMTLDHLEGLEAGGVPYKGKLPDELRAYIASVRKALADEQRRAPR